MLRGLKASDVLVKQMNSQFQILFSILVAPSDRLPEIQKWLRNEVWSPERFANMGYQDYLESGEKMVRYAEDMVLSGAPRVYDELVAASQTMRNLLGEFGGQKTTIVVFDGCSIRELPLFVRLAESTGFRVTEARYTVAALPSDTLGFVEQRLLGKRIAPSQLESRKELKDVGITARYYDSTIRVQELGGLGDSLLLWSSFPDGTYMNFEAKTSGHFEAIVKQFDVVWKNIILSVPRGHRIIITSDHGYTYLRAGFESDPKGEAALEALRNDRFRMYEADEEMPTNIQELQIVEARKTAMLRGRIKNRRQGPSANKMFRHGGMSIMEMLTPYLVLEQPSSIQRG